MSTSITNWMNEMLTDRELLDKAGQENGEYYSDDYIKTLWFASYKFRYAVIEFLKSFVNLR